ncbi:hypothetical protein BD408DRAFT_207242 [Parasitella parasitica]|nr:hypothetical protein BD408DRAFT_207242 [Parasitella parasitica]
MKHEEIKTKVPIIIASVPHEKQPEQNLMTKYALEETAGSRILPCKPEYSNHANDDDDCSTHNGGNVSICRDTHPIVGDDNAEERDHQTDIRAAALMFPGGSPSLPLASTAYMVNSCNFFDRRALTPTLPSTATHLQSSNQRQIKKFASAFDLGITSKESLHLDNQRQLGERSRTAIPTIKRSHVQRKQLQPIDVDLANGKK